MLDYSQNVQHNVLSTLVQHQHRLVSLEIYLQESYKTKQVSGANYSVRDRFIKSQLQKVQALISLYSDLARTENEHINLGIPILDRCTPMERQLSFNFLAERKELLIHLHKDAQKILKWIEKILSQRSSRFFTVFRLSRLRKKLSKIDYWLGELEYENQQVDQQTKKLTLLANKSQKFSANLEGLIALFNDVDKIYARVTRLKQGIHDNEMILIRMREWLRTMTPELARPITFQPPPSRNQSDLAQNLSQDLMSSPLYRTQKNLFLAKNYIQQCIDKLKEKETPPQKTTRSGDLNLGKSYRYPHPPPPNWQNLPPRYDPRGRAQSSSLTLHTPKITSVNNKKGKR